VGRRFREKKMDGRSAERLKAADTSKKNLTKKTNHTCGGDREEYRERKLKPRKKDRKER